MLQKALFDKLIRLENLPHAILLHGGRGVGKFSLALSLAHHLIGSPSLNTNNPDLVVIEPESGHSIKIDTIRALKETMMNTPHHGQKRAVIIRNAEQMTLQAANALLKLLEEPPERRVFILTTEAASRLPATILSRCYREFCPVPVDASASQDNDIDDVMRLVDGAPGYAQELISQDFISENNWLIQTLSSLVTEQLSWALLVDAIEKKPQELLALSLQILLLDLMLLKRGIAAKRNLSQIAYMEIIVSKLDINKLFHYHEIIVEQIRNRQISLVVILAEIKNETNR